MFRRVFVSLAALSLTIFAVGEAFASSPPAVARSDFSAPQAASAPVDFSFDLKNAPQSDPAMEAQEAARRALKLYDELVNRGSFSLNAIKPKTSFGPHLNEGAVALGYDFKSSLYEPVYASELDRDRFGTERLISNQSQRSADRIADLISPGFGRTEFQVGESHVRIDYIYAKRCRMRGVGVCLQVTFR